jgi:hypothetical protein
MTTPSLEISQLHLTIKELLERNLGYDQQLAGMAVQTIRAAVDLLRPLLGYIVKKQDVVGTSAASCSANQPIIGYLFATVVVRDPELHLILMKDGRFAEMISHTGQGTNGQHWHFYSWASDAATYYPIDDVLKGLAALKSSAEEYKNQLNAQQQTALEKLARIQAIVNETDLPLDSREITGE